MNRGSVDHILQSATFRNAPSSRRLLQYLADHSLEPLKEYSIGVDAFGKPEGYDPRLDSTVRIQIGRLRQRLADYYQDEGRNDPVVIELPKGQFQLTAGPIFSPAAEVPPRRTWHKTALIAANLAVILLAALWFLKVRTAAQGNWTPELTELWRPFLENRKPLVVVVGNPLFLQLENKAVYRDLSVEDAEIMMRTPQFEALSQSLANHTAKPVHYYAAVGDVSAAFELGARLAPRQQAMSIVRSSQLQWQQIADSNVLFLGPPRFFGDQLGNLPVVLEIAEGNGGFQIAHPGSGEPAFFKYREPDGFFSEDGQATVLITHAPGPVGNTDVMTFAGNSTFGRAGAVAAFTDPAFVKSLAPRLRGASGRIPQYFQVLLRVKYKGGVPTATSYLLHRELKRRN